MPGPEAPRRSWELQGPMTPWEDVNHLTVHTVPHDASLIGFRATLGGNVHTGAVPPPTGPSGSQWAGDGPGSAVPSSRYSKLAAESDASAAFSNYTTGASQFGHHTG